MSSFIETTGDTNTLTTRPKFLPSVGLPNLKQRKNADEPEIFSKRKMVLRIPEGYTGDFMHVTVSKNWLICLLNASPQVTLFRFFLPRAIPPGEIALDKYLAGYKITKLFLDNTGHHLLISLVPQIPGLSADFLYIHGNGPKVRRIEKFKDHEITAVAFNNYMGTESCTGPILLGTSRGLIFETELTHEADKPSYRKQVYDLGLGRPKYPITGLELLQIPQSNTYAIVAAAPDCIYTFQETLKPEEKSLQAIFTPYVNGQKIHNTIEVKTDFNYSVLRFFAAPNEKYPKNWAWLCGAGIRHGQVSTDVTCDSVLLGDELINLNFEKSKHLASEERSQILPKTFAITEYHVLLLYSDHITGICQLNDEVVYEEHFHERLGKLLNIVRDPFTGTIYFYTEKSIFNYKITDEERDIWQIYLNKGMFDLAEFHAIENPFNMDIVLEKRAETAFDNKQYEEAAKIYSESEKPFEEICLKFMDLEDKKPIVIFVKRRLNKLSDDNTEHIKVLVIWLVDLYLTEINLPGRSEAERAAWQKEYDEFMREKRVAKCAMENRVVIKNLISQHADSHNLSQFATQNGDYEEVIIQQLSAGNYTTALYTLRKQRDVELYYKYCPILIEHLPFETVEVLMSQGRKLQVEKLVPTLITIDTPKQIEEVIKYLEFAIFNLGETNQAVHNFMLRLYSEHQPGKVVSYLENEGHDVSLVHYDINYALSICSEFKINSACVHLYCLLQMWTDAVDLALSFNVQLAKDTASKPRDEETRRKLWLTIAYHDIKGTNDVKKALALLKECDLLRIEDLLPFFSDFEKIDDFKEPICYALKEYNQKIHELQHDMDECTKQADRVRSDLQNVRERVIRIEAHETCTNCESFLLVKPFFVFSCGHKFHADCLEKQVTPLLTSEKSRKLAMLNQQLEAMLTQSIAMADHSPTQQKKREKLKLEIEEILASDCLYCGIMIEAVDQPFVEDWDQVNVDWE